MLVALSAGASSASAACQSFAESEYVAPATVQVSVVAHHGHSSAHPGYTTLSVITDKTEDCVGLEASIGLIGKENPEGGPSRYSLKDTATISEGSRVLLNGSWEVRTPGEAEPVVLPRGGGNGEEEAHIVWSCRAPGVVGSYNIVSEGLVGAPITSTGQFGTVSATWCAAEKHKEAIARKHREEERKREAAQYKRERPEREAEERAHKTKEEQEDSNSSGGAPRAERAIERAAESENQKAVLIHCRRIAADAFYCQFEYAPLYNRHYHATVHFEGSHTYVGPIEETV
jgi:hypothetical protein